MDSEENCFCAFETNKLQCKAAVALSYSERAQLMRQQQHNFPFTVKTLRSSVSIFII